MSRDVRPPVQMRRRITVLSSVSTGDSDIPSSCVDFGYTDLFCIPDLTSEFISPLTVFLGTLWCSIKKIEAPDAFNWEYNIALHEMQGNQASSPSEGYVSWDFSSCGRNVAYILELQR